MGNQRLVCSTTIATLATATLATAFALVAAQPASAQSQSDIVISVNGTQANVSPAPVNQAGRVFVPLRGVFEYLGASVVYDAGEINATGNGRDISLHLGSTSASVDGTNESLDVAPFLIGDSTYGPLRFISEALGATVSWDDSDSTVSISTEYAQPVAQQTASPVYSDVSYVRQAPPPLPYYELPPVPAPNDIWQPGYWAFSNAGYYWVPGVWVPAPQPNLLWTPGYWAVAVGFYGGINYGGGYFGHGYGGGRWLAGAFHYNTAVTPVHDTTIIKNVYVDKTVVNDITVVNRTSYDGGPHGIAAAPTPRELQVQRTPHVPATIVQAQHRVVAAQDRQQLSTVNHGTPPVTVAPHPFTAREPRPEAVPVTDEDRFAAKKLIAPRPMVRPVPVIGQPARRYVAPATSHRTIVRAVPRSAPAARPHPHPTDRGR